MKILAWVVLFMLMASVVSAEPVYDKEEIRKQWEQSLGCDVWRPYFFYLEIEDKLKEKLSIHIGPFKGRPDYNYYSKRLEYRFTMKF